MLMNSERKICLENRLLKRKTMRSRERKKKRLRDCVEICGRAMRGTDPNIAQISLRITNSVAQSVKEISHRGPNAQSTQKCAGIHSENKQRKLD